MFIEVPAMFGTNFEEIADSERLGIQEPELQTEVDIVVIDVSGIETFNRHSEKGKTTVWFKSERSITVMMDFGKFKELINSVSPITKL
jgi:hypothetical protein